MHAFSKISTSKNNVLEDLVPEREATNKNEPRESTPVKKFGSHISQRYNPESGNASPVSIPDGNRSQENVKISFGLPLKRENNQVTIPSTNSLQDNDGGSTPLVTGGVRKNSPA